MKGFSSESVFLVLALNLSRMATPNMFLPILLSIIHVNFTLYDSYSITGIIINTFHINSNIFMGIMISRHLRGQTIVCFMQQRRTFMSSLGTSSTDQVDDEPPSENLAISREELLRHRPRSTSFNWLIMKRWDLWITKTLCFVTDGEFCVLIPHQKQQLPQCACFLEGVSCLSLVTNMYPIYYCIFDYIIVP